MIQKIELSKRTGFLTGDDITLDEVGSIVQAAMRAGATGREPFLSMAHGGHRHTSYVGVEIDNTATPSVPGEIVARQP